MNKDEDPLKYNPHLNITPLIIRELVEERKEVGSILFRDYAILSLFLSPLRNTFGLLQMSIP
jgi:hypothetical protein